MNSEDPLIRGFMKSPENWGEYEKLVGRISIEFARIESETLALLAFFVEVGRSSVCKTKVGSLPHSRALRELEQLIESGQLFRCTTDASALVGRLRQAGDDRNEIIHAVAALVPNEEGEVSLEPVRDKFAKDDNPKTCKLFQELDDTHSSLAEVLRDLRTFRMEMLQKDTEQNKD